MAIIDQRLEKEASDNASLILIEDFDWGKLNLHIIKLKISGHSASRIVCVRLSASFQKPL
jgi:hypothetical protein